MGHKETNSDKIVQKKEQKIVLMGKCLEKKRGGTVD